MQATDYITDLALRINTYTGHCPICGYDLSNFYIKVRGGLPKIEVSGKTYRFCGWGCYNKFNLKDAILWQFPRMVAEKG